MAPENLQEEIQYYRQLTDELGATNIAYDARLAAATTEVRKLKEGLILLNDLQRSIDAQALLEEVYERVLKALNTGMRMDKTVVLTEDPDVPGGFRIKAGLGLAQAVQERWQQETLRLGSDALAAHDDHWLVTKQQPAEGAAATMSEALGIPFFVAVPFFIHQHRVGILVCGRNKEMRPFFPPLGDAEVAMFQTIGAYLSVSAANSGAYHILEGMVSDRTQELQAEKEKSDHLLLNILPAEVAQELKESGTAQARQYNDVSVLFTDFVGFSQIAERLSPAELVTELNEYFTAFDGIAARHGIEKIKTMGDAYLAVCGLPAPAPDHALRVARAALEIRDFSNARKAANPEAFDIRVGIHSGNVVAGIVGVKKFAYDIWGDTVNITARMEQTCEPGRINISGDTYALIKDHFPCIYRGRLPAKNKGDIDMYFLE